MKIQHSPTQNHLNMTALLPNSSLLRIGQTAKATGCTPKALRLYEQRGLIPPAIRQGQYRYYHAEHLRFIEVIKLAQRAGFRLNELIALLGVKRQQGHIPLSSIEQAIANKLAQQQQQIDALQQQQQVLVGLRQVCQQLFAQPVRCVEPQQVQQTLDSAL